MSKPTILTPRELAKHSLDELRHEIDLDGLLRSRAENFKRIETIAAAIAALDEPEQVSPATTLPQPHEIWRLLVDEEKKEGDEFESDFNVWNPTMFPGEKRDTATHTAVRRRELVYYPADVAALVSKDARPKCGGCGKPLLYGNLNIADGCPCNNPRGINHGKVPMSVCTCEKCDPLQTGSVRVAVRYSYGIREAIRGRSL